MHFVTNINPKFGPGRQFVGAAKDAEFAALEREVNRLEAEFATIGDRVKQIVSDVVKATNIAADLAMNEKRDHLAAGGLMNAKNPFSGRPEGFSDDLADYDLNAAYEDGEE